MPGVVSQDLWGLFFVNWLVLHIVLRMDKLCSGLSVKTLGFWTIELMDVSEVVHLYALTIIADNYLPTLQAYGRRKRTGFVFN